MEVTATIEYDRGDETFEMEMSNFDENVKIQAPGLFEGAVYLDRQQLIQALCALEAGA